MEMMSNMGYYSELDISRYERGLRAKMGMYDDYSGNIDEIIEKEIKKYEEIYGKHDYYGFKDGKIYGIMKEDLERELAKYEREIDEGRMEYYTLDEVDSMLKKRLNIKENENGD